MVFMILHELVDISKAIPSGVYTIAGVLLGAGITWIKSVYDNRPRLSAAIVDCKTDFDISSDKMVKTSPSGYAVELYNIGRDPLLLISLSVCGDDSVLMADGLIHKCIAIKPYDKYLCPLMWQDYESIRYHCTSREHIGIFYKLKKRILGWKSFNDNNLLTCMPKIWGKTVEGKCVKGKLVAMPIVMDALSIKMQNQIEGRYHR